MTTEEKREYNRKWYLKNKEKIIENAKRYYQDNKDKIKQQNLDNKEKRKEYDKQRYIEKKEKLLAQMKSYRDNNHEKELERNKLYYETQIGRANRLINGYSRADKKYNRGECTLTPDWFIKNIFSKPCHYNCGETDWRNMGCDRIDNSKPHTPDNVVPCCTECNTKRGRKSYEKWLLEIGMN